MRKHIKILFLIITLQLTNFIEAKEIKLGIISDFRENFLKKELFSIKDEIQKGIGASHSIVMEDSYLKYADWDTDKAIRAYKELENSCDIIIAIGTISIQAATQKGEVTKPTIGIGVFDTEIQNVKITPASTSGVKNFSYVLSSVDIYDEISRFHELVSFKNLTVVLDDRSFSSYNTDKAAEKLKKLSEEFNTKIGYVRLSENLDESLNKITDSTDAVFVTLPYERSEAELKIITDYFIKRKLPSFTISSYQLNNGMMAAYSSPRSSMNYIFRKIAVMIDDYIAGTPLEEQSVTINEKKELTINMPVAHKVGYSPNMEILFTANIVGDMSQEGMKEYSIEDVIKIAMEENLDFKISKKEVEEAYMDYAIAKSNLLPTSDLSATGAQIDDHRANAAIGQAEKSVKATAQVQQVIYSDQVFANITIQKYLTEASKYGAEQAANDLIMDAFSYYINVLKAKTNIIIQKENYEASKKNLELATLRVSLGSSNNSDVYRWKSEVATSRQKVLESQTSYVLALTQLRTLLNNKIEEEFKIADISPENKFFKAFFEDYRDADEQTPENLKKIIDFMIEEAKINHPLEKQLMSNMKVVDRQKKMYKRRYFTPTVALQAQGDNVMWRGGKASDPLPGSSFEDLSWNVGISLSYKLFDGTKRKRDYQKAKIQEEKLEMQKYKLDNNLRLNIISKTLSLLTSTTNLEFSKISSENAQKNFELVQENYKQGAVSVVQLIDSQKAALSAKQGHAISVYDFLKAHIELEYSLGKFMVLADNDDSKAFKERMLKIINE